MDWFLLASVTFLGRRLAVFPIPRFPSGQEEVGRGTGKLHPGPCPAVCLISPPQRVATDVSCSRVQAVVEVTQLEAINLRRLV